MKYLERILVFAACSFTFNLPIAIGGLLAGDSIGWTALSLSFAGAVGFWLMCSRDFCIRDGHALGKTVRIGEGVEEITDRVYWTGLAVSILLSMFLPWGGFWSYLALMIAGMACSLAYDFQWLNPMFSAFGFRTFTDGGMVFITRGFGLKAGDSVRYQKCSARIVRLYDPECVEPSGDGAKTDEPAEADVEQIG